MSVNMLDTKRNGQSILSAIGYTPLVELKNMYRGSHFRMFVKLEGLNPGGSMKDRPARRIIEQGLRTGLIKSDTVIIESSSGNMGIGLAQVCAIYKLRFICVVDPKTTAQNIKLLKAYGAELDYVTKPDPETGEYLPARINRVRQLLATVRHGLWPDQYSNQDNSLSHHQTMQEIVDGLVTNPDYLFCATSTCGTIRGCSDYLHKHNLKTKIFAVDAQGSVIFGGKKSTRLIPGHGAAVRPALYRPDMIDDCIYVSDLDCVVGCRRLVKHEAILAGGSSGAVMTAVELARDRIAPGSTCVAILPDRGERYLETIYSDEWVHQHFGYVEHLWHDSAAMAAI